MKETVGRITFGPSLAEKTDGLVSQLFKENPKLLAKYY